MGHNLYTYFITDFSVFIPIFAGVLISGLLTFFHFMYYVRVLRQKKSGFIRSLFFITALRMLLIVLSIVACFRLFREQLIAFTLSILISYIAFSLYEIIITNNQLDQKSLPNV